jgi:hypothetical protein
MFSEHFQEGMLVAVIPALYMGNAFNKLSVIEQSTFPFVTVLCVLPFVYGFVYASLRTVIKLDNRLLMMVVVGAVAGEIYSLLGHYGGFNIPSRVFKMQQPHQVHIFAPIMYAAIYGLLSMFFLS